jgi:hypothetical protein
MVVLLLLGIHLRSSLLGIVPAALTGTTKLDTTHQLLLHIKHTYTE